MGNVGTPKKVTLDGTTFDVFSDTNITEVGSSYETEALPTSGKNIFKKTRRAENREGVVLAADGAERDILRGLADRLEPFPMSYETIAGDVYRATGMIEFENRETEEGRATIQMLPLDKWTSFLA